MAEIDIYDFDYLQGGAIQGQIDAQIAAASASTVVVGVGTTAQIVGFDSGGNPQPKSVGGNGNGVTLAFNGNILQANADQDLKTSGSPTFAAITIDSTGNKVEAIRSAVATLDFPNTLAQTSSDLTITVTGASVDDPVFWSAPAAPDANSCFTAWVSAGNTVTIRFNNYSAGAIDPAPGSFRVCVFKF